MRLRSPTPLDWDTDPLPDDFELIADADHNHEMHEVVDASNHAAVRLLAEGWVRLPDRDEKTKALIIARLEEAEAEGELDMPAEQARAEGRDLETLVARMRERLLSTEFDKKIRCW